MDITVRDALGLHIVMGYIALVVAPGAMLTQKGGVWHRRWGKIYFWAMAGVALTAVLLSLIRPNVFLLLLAVFSLYQAFSGYRVLSRKLPQRGQQATPLDGSAAVLQLLLSAVQPQAYPIEGSGGDVMWYEATAS
jgi:uncharacterized membrane protein YfcA